MTEEQQTEQGERRAEPAEGHETQADASLDLPDIERSAEGIPTFVFKESLPDADKPTSQRKSLEMVLLWREAVMTVGHYPKARDIFIGDQPKKNDFVVASDALTSDQFPLVKADGDSFLVTWNDQMTIEVRNESGEILNGAELAKRNLVTPTDVSEQKCSQYKVGLHDRVAVQIGEVTFVLQFVSPARLVTSSILKTIDQYFTKILSVSFVAHLFFILALLALPTMPKLEDDLFKNPNRFAQLLLKEPEKAPQQKKKFELSGSKGGGKHKDKEGKFGKPDKPKQDALASKKGAPKVDPNKREKDRKIAQNAGIFKALRGGKGGAVSSVLGPGGLGTGMNDAMGGLRGQAMGDAGGAGGLGLRGSGGGGGGNSLGIGGLGSGTGRGTGGLGNVDLGGRGKGKYKVSVGRTITKGCLQESVVRRVLKRAQSQARYCYEKELQRNPNLSGKVTTQISIGSTGSVMRVGIAESTLGNSSVESCLQRVLGRLRFPPCAGGGVADITYPYIFKPTS